MNEIKTPQEILDTKHLSRAERKKYFKDGIEIEKGAIITEKRIERYRELYEKYCHYWSVYPDKFVDTITPTNSKFSLKFFQRYFLRACVRHGRVLTIAPRAAGKSFICVLALMLICIFRPGSNVFICAPGKSQGARIAGQKVKQLWEMLPLLKAEIIGEGNFGSDYIKLSYRNGSQFTVMSPLNSTRGNRATCGIIDEFRQKIFRL